MITSPRFSLAAVRLTGAQWLTNLLRALVFPFAGSVVSLLLWQAVA